MLQATLINYIVSKIEILMSDKKCSLATYVNLLNFQNSLSDILIRTFPALCYSGKHIIKTTT